MKRSLAFLLAALMCLSLCACGRSGSVHSDSAQSSYKEAAYEMSAPMAMNAAYDMAYEDAGFGMMNMAASKTTARGTDSSASGGVDAPEENPEKIIYSGDATIETTEFEKSIEALEKMIRRLRAALSSPAPSTAITTTTAPAATPRSAAQATPCACRARSLRS